MTDNPFDPQELSEDLLQIVAMLLPPFIPDPRIPDSICIKTHAVFVWQDVIIMLYQHEALDRVVVLSIPRPSGGTAFTIDVAEVEDWQARELLASLKHALDPESRELADILRDQIRRNNARLN